MIFDGIVSEQSKYKDGQMITKEQVNNLNKFYRYCVIVLLSLQLTGFSALYRELCSPAIAADSVSDLEDFIFYEEILDEDISYGESTKEDTVILNETAEDEAPWNYYDPTGMTLQTRINPPAGYTRPYAEPDSLTAFLRNYPLKEHGAPVLLYDGTQKEDQTVHAAVFALPIEAQDFQQCADSIMRIYAEYYWSLGQQEELSFHFTEDFTADYEKWRDGYHIQFSGDRFNWIKSAEYDASYETFTKYMRMVFAYAGTYSMDTWESTEISPDEMQVGDVFIKGDSLGHAMLVVDICYNDRGERAFLLAQGHMPAQEFQLAKNPAHLEDPWYYENEVIYPFETIEYIFPEECLQRLTY